LKNKFKALAVFLGAIIFVWAFWKSELLNVLGQDINFDLTLFGMWGGTLVIGLFVGGYFFDQPPISREEISKTVKQAVDENMKDLSSRVIEEIRKNRNFKKVNP